MDQSSFAAPHSLSQRITSFIACACQGIHQMPLRHLIVLIANAHRLVTTSLAEDRDRPGYLLQPSQSNNAIDVFDKSALLELRRAAHFTACLKTSFSRLNPGSRGQATIISKPSEADPRKDQPTTTDQSDKLPSYLPSFPKLRSARPWQGSSGQGSDTGLPRYLEASRSIFSLQCIWNRRRPTGRRKLILSPRISSPLVSTPKSYWWS